MAAGGAAEAAVYHWVGDGRHRRDSRLDLSDLSRDLVCRRPTRSMTSRPAETVLKYASEPLLAKVMSKRTPRLPLTAPTSKCRELRIIISYAIRFCCIVVSGTLAAQSAAAGAVSAAYKPTTRDIVPEMRPDDRVLDGRVAPVLIADAGNPHRDSVRSRR